MSFCNEVKSELALIKAKKCCQRAESMGLALALKAAGDRLVFRTTQAEVAHLAAILMDKQLGAAGETHVSASGSWYSLFYPGSVRDSAGIPGARIDTARLEKPCCVNAFLRGAFLSCGHMVDPQKNYRLDFSLPDEATGAAFCDVLRESGFVPRRSLRRDGSVLVYFIDSTSVEDLLTSMGATNASLSLMEVKVEKNYSNVVNRRGNFDTANYVKTFAKAEAQVEAIRRLEAAGALADLPEETQLVARLRLEHSDASLNELAQLSHLGRSTVDRRLKSLTALAETLDTGR